MLSIGKQLDWVRHRGECKLDDTTLLLVIFKPWVVEDIVAALPYSTRWRCRMVFDSFVG